MITGLINIIYYLLVGIINIFPSGTGFPTEVHTAFSTLGGYVGLMDVFVPVSVMLWCLTLVFGVEIAIFGFKTIKWIISFIPLIGGKGNQ
jgi:hypothetical protein